VSLASIVDWDALLTVVWASLVAGVGASAAYGFAILGSTRAVDLGRDGRSGGATVFGAVGVIGIALVIAAIVVGLVVLTE
jgi:hypothetical protein